MASLREISKIEYAIYDHLIDDHMVISVADPGFPRGGGANSPGGVPTYDFVKISQKLHEIERIWTPRGGRASPAPPLRSATGKC